MTLLPSPDLVQRVSLPLELIGLLLTLMEIYFPKQANWLERFITHVPYMMKKSRFMSTAKIYALSNSFAENIKGAGWTLVVCSMNILLQWILHSESGMSFLSITIIMFSIGSFLMLFSNHIDKNWLYQLLYFLYIPIGTINAVLLFGTTFFIFVAIRKAVMWIGQLGKGKSIGGVGLLFAGFGIVGEVYQVVYLTDSPVAQASYWLLLLLFCIVLFIVGFMVNHFYRMELKSGRISEHRYDKDGNLIVTKFHKVEP